MTDILLQLADEIDSQAAIASRYGQTADLERIATEMRAEGDRINKALDAAIRVVVNSYGTKPRHTRSSAGGCRDDCIPCGLSDLRTGLINLRRPS